MPVKKTLRLISKAAKGAVSVAIASKYRKGRTGSKTRTRTKKRRMGVHSSGGINSSYFTVVLNKKTPKHAQGRWTYTQTNVLSTAVSAGLQAFDEVTAMGTYSQLNTSAGITNNALESQVGLKFLNANYLNTGSGYLPGASTPTTDAYMIKSMKMVCEFTSWSNVSQEVDLYYFKCVSGTQDSVRIVWERGYQQQGSGIGVMTQLNSPLFRGTAGYGKVNEPFAAPHDVGRYLSSVYRLVKHTKIHLQSGATHTCTVNFITNKVIRQSKMDQAFLDGESGVPGVTVYLVAVVRGQVVKDTSASMPTYSSTSVGYICRNTYLCHPVQCPNARRETAIHAYNIPIATAGANQSIIDVVDDTDTVKQL